MGIICAWDSKDRNNERVMDLLKKEILIPVSPEHLVSLPTPRAPQEIQGYLGEEKLDNKYRVINKNEADILKQFIQGA